MGSWHSPRVAPDGELRPWEAVPGRALQVAEVVEATFLVRGGPKLVVQMMVPVATG